MEVPLPWERLLWRGGPALTARLTQPRRTACRYVLTDFRLVSLNGADVDEIVLDDIGEVHRRESALDRAIGVSTIEVHSRRPRPAPLVLQSVRRGAQLAALLELLSTDRQMRVDADFVAAAIAWEPRNPHRAFRKTIPALLLGVIVLLASAVGLHGRPVAVTFGPDDAIAPNGQKKERDAIGHFMRAEVIPWARNVLGPIVGGADQVRCETCHGADAATRGWQMPGVAALPVPAVQESGWELYSSQMDAQMRNAIYGYAAESDKQGKATYMRELVMPGMARLLHRAPYDFTRPYSFNRQRAAFGCYHCHKVR